MLAPKNPVKWKTQPRCQDSPSKTPYNNSKLTRELNMFSEVQPKKYQVDVVHKVATEWYSGYRLVCVKLDGSRNTTPWQPCEQPQHGIP